MYKNITITGFSDEISSVSTEQFETLNQLGISYFDPRNVDGTNISSLTDAQVDDLLAKMEKYNIKVACLGSPIGKIGIHDDFEPHMALLENTIRIAKKLGTKYIRIFSFFIPKDETPESCRDEVMFRMKKMADLAEQEGVILLHENEKDIYGDTAIRCKDVLDAVNSKALGCVFDPANFVQCGENVKTAIDLLLPYVNYLHIKDALADGTVVPAGQGAGEVEYVISSLLQNGYKGFACLEPHLGSFDGLADLELEDDMLKLEKSDGAKFKLAYDSLKKILDKVGA